MYYVIVRSHVNESTHIILLFILCTTKIITMLGGVIIFAHMILALMFQDIASLMALSFILTTTYENYINKT